MTEHEGAKGPRVDPIRRGSGRAIAGRLTPLLTGPRRNLIGSKPRPIKPAPKGKS